MKVVVDANLSPKIAIALVDQGIDASHVVDLGLLSASDELIFERAAESGSAVLTGDSDFAALLAARRAAAPSVIQLRGVADLRPEAHIGLLLANLDSIVAALATPGIISLSPTSLRVRSLPIGDR